jgi:hypothetical protein
MSLPPNQYLKKILEQETFANEDDELKGLRKRRDDVRDLLNSHFSESNPSIRWAGSMAKGTMVRTSYDGDVTCYFPHEDEPEKTLQALYKEVEKVLQDNYIVERKPSALRIRDKATDNYYVDLHLDVVPGRFTDENESDVFLHRTTGEKERLKTNLLIHIEHVKKSGVRPAIRLAKIWNVRHGVGTKTFILELLVVKLLEEKKSKKLSDQLLHVWTQFRDNSADLTVEDPANPTGNDLTPLLDECRATLSAVAATTLANIEASGWTSVFGEVEEEDDDDGGGGSKGNKSAALGSAAAAVSRPTKPWAE